ncbi:MAG: hypothetical protein CL685_00060 [Candidatus Magasanikbacteria bacterium]|nr:hypothetical protein [Candidatus Magasanikbacteria bacterium]|tara:strand:+ start:8788 stop:9741 length:954 start_codon:yes stop_codon:yes gene_type:complete
MKKKNIVVIAGGCGGAKTIRALYPLQEKVQVSAVVPMSDSGRSTGVLRKRFSVVPPSDIMRVTLAMTQYDYETVRNIFHKTRFRDSGPLQNYYLGNLFLAWSFAQTQDFLCGLRALHEVVNAYGKTLPSTLSLTDLCASLADGQELIGEHVVDRPNKNQQARIVRSWLNPKAIIYSEAKNAIEQADYILLGPGSLYTSIIATLLVDGMQEAIRNSKAKIIYIAGNTYEIKGECGPKVLSSAIDELEQYVPKKIDTVIYCTATDTKDMIEKYKKREIALLKYDKENLTGRVVVAKDFARYETGGLCAEKLSHILNTVI